MNIAPVGHNWWTAACEAAGGPFEVLPPAVQPPANPYSADIGARSAVAQQWQARLQETDAELLLDNGGTGLAFLPDPGGGAGIKLLHEIAGVPLASHFIDPLVTVFQGLPWAVTWQALRSNTWFKFVWDKPQTEELIRFGIPNVHHLPMAAPDHSYNTEPLDPSAAEYPLSFVGGQNTSYFHASRNVPANTLLRATLGLAVRADSPDISFASAYYDLYRLAEPPSAEDDQDTQVRKVIEYFSHKLFYNASLCLRQRDRFVIFLKQKLGDVFTLIGDRWDTAYGLPCKPRLTTTEEYLDHFRRAAVNLNLVNGNSDSGLNMRHFEITAAGGFLLCYHMAEIDDFFEVGTECETFRDEQELLEKVRFYLEHPQKRIEIAHAGQQRTLKNHLYSHRVGQVVDAIQTACGKPLPADKGATAAAAQASAP